MRFSFCQKDNLLVVTDAQEHKEYGESGATDQQVHVEDPPPRSGRNDGAADERS